MKQIFKKQNYITVQGFMVTELGLSGNELLCYALVYGFSQMYGNEYDGSLTYVSSALNVTRDNARKIIGRLVQKELIEKRDTTINGVKKCYYSVIHKEEHEDGEGVTEIVTGVTKTVTGGVTKTVTPINNINNNIIIPPSAHTREDDKLTLEDAARGVMQIIELYNRRVADTKQKACSIQTLSPLIRGNLVELIRKHGYDAVRDVIIKATEPGTFTAEHVNTSLKWIVDEDNFGNIADGIYEKEDNNGRGEEKKAERCGSDRSDAQPLAEPHRLKRL